MTKTILAIAIGIFAFSGSNAVAQMKANMAKISCGDLSKMSAEEYVVTGAWMSGYYNAKRHNAMIDIKQLAENSKKVVEFCKENPKMTVMKAIERLSKAKK